MKKQIIFLIVSLVTAFIMIFNAFAGPVASKFQSKPDTFELDLYLMGLSDNLQKITEDLKRIKPKPIEPAFVKLPIVKELDQFAQALCELRDIVYNPAVDEVMKESRSVRDMYEKVKDASNRFCSMFDDLKTFIAEVEIEAIPRAQSVHKRFECLTKTDAQLENDSVCKVVGCYNRKACIAETLREMHKFLRPFVDNLFAKQVIGQDGKLLFDSAGRAIIDEGALLQLMHFDEFVPTFVRKQLQQKMPHIDALLSTVTEVNQKLLIPLIVYVIVPIFDLLPALSVAINPPTLQKLSDEMREKLTKLPEVKIPSLDELLDELLVQDEN